MNIEKIRNKKKQKGKKMSVDLVELRDKAQATIEDKNRFSEHLNGSKGVLILDHGPSMIFLKKLRICTKCEIIKRLLEMD